MNITTRDQFEYALQYIKDAEVVVVDTETNTLRVRSADKMPLVSIQVYLPQWEQSYNFSFRAGYGDLFLSDGTKLTPDRDTDEPNYDLKKLSGRDRRTAYWFRLWTWWRERNMQALLDEAFAKPDEEIYPDPMGNLPFEWHDELKEVMTPEKTYIYHNANFDLTVLDREGYAPQPNVRDTMIAVQFAWGDWGGKRNRDDKGIKVKMPNRYGGKVEWGNRKLKWQARFWDFDDAEAGEQALAQSSVDFVTEVVDYAVKSVENDPSLHDYLFPLGSYASWRKNPNSVDSEEVSWHDRQAADTYTKVSWNSKELKGRIWMLPSWAVTQYGELDVILTSKLHDKCMQLIRGWDIEDVYDEISAINTQLAWRMEQNGLLLDVEEAQRRIDANYAEADAIMEKYDWNIDSWQEVRDRVGKFLNLPDTQAGTLRDALEWIDPDTLYEDGGDIGADMGIMGSEAIQIINDRLTYKSIIKQTSTYLKRWVNAADKNNYIHAYIDVAGTKTGRTSSSGDMGNTQNIPSRSANIKEVLITPPDHLVFGVDYSNLELRVAAWIAEQIHGYGNNEMTDAINNFDAHAKTAEDLGVRNIMYPNMTDAQIAEYENMANWESLSPEKLEELVYKFFIRQAGKTANFNLIYKGSYWSLGIQMGENFETEYSGAKKGTPDYKKHWDILTERFEKYKVLHAKWHEMYPAFGDIADDCL
jgi:DNA polymerase I-like protein with 3'-5' exonuclease and polymerase domains